MGKFDLIYKDIVTDVIDNGVWDKDQNVRTRWSDGTPAYTKSVICKQVTLDNSDVPILTSKQVGWKWAIHELLWFYVHRTSNTKYLKDNNVTIWQEWEREDGTIGLAYGHQLGKKIRTGFTHTSYDDGTPNIYVEKTNQVHKLIKELKTNPSSRRHVISLWNIDDAWDMALQPCVWHNQWLVKEGKLHLIVGIRSSDTALGLPYNVFQYYVLQRMISQVTGYEMGTLTFNINDSHIYEKHIDTLNVQIQNEPIPAPTLWVNPEIKNFDDFTINDFKLIDYKHHGKHDYEVAI